MLIAVHNVITIMICFIWCRLLIELWLTMSFLFVGVKKLGYSIVDLCWITIVFRFNTNYLLLAFISSDNIVLLIFNNHNHSNFNLLFCALLALLIILKSFFRLVYHCSGGTINTCCYINISKYLYIVYWRIFAVLA